MDQNIIQKAKNAVLNTAKKIFQPAIDYSFNNPNTGFQRIGNEIKSNPSQFNVLSSFNIKNSIPKAQELIKTNIPVVKQLGQFGSNVIKPFSAGQINISSGVSQIKQGGVGNILGGTVKSLYGLGQTAVPATPLYMGANLLTSIAPSIGTGGSLVGAPNKAQISRLGAGLMKGISGVDDVAENVMSQKMKVGPFEVDPFMGAGNMIGFTKNPFNDYVFGKTKVFDDLKPFSSTLANFFASKGVKGGVEGLIQAYTQLDPKMSNSEKAKFIAENVIMGAGMEIGTGILGKGVDKIKQQKQIAEWIKRNSTVIYTHEYNPKTKLYEKVGRPLWQEKLKNLNEFLKEKVPGGKQGFGNVAESIRDEAGNIKPEYKGLTPEVNPLIAEAKKYKSAEEFVKAQGEPVFHGTDAKFDSFDIKKSGSKGNDIKFDNAIYVSQDKNFVKQYGKNTVEARISPNAKVINYDNIKYENGFYEFLDQKIKENPNYDRLNAKQDFAKESGFDVIKYGQNEIVVLNPEILKTNSQLTDIYNQSQSGLTPEVNPLIAEASKYKTFQDFKNGQYDASSISQDPKNISWFTKLNNDINSLDRNNLLKEIPKNKNGEFTINPNKVISEKLTNFNKTYGTKLTVNDFQNGNINGQLRNDLQIKNYEKQLAEVYSKANGKTPPLPEPFQSERLVVQNNPVPQSGLTPEVTTKVKIKPKIKPATVQEPIQLPVKNISPTEKLSLPQGDYTLKQPIGETTSKYNIGKNKTVNQRVLKQALDEVAPSFEKVSGSPITHEQIIKQAGEFSDEVVKTIGRQTTEQLGAAQLRLRQNIANMADSGQVTPELLEAMKTDASFARSTAQLLGQRAIDANPRTPYGKNMIKYVEEVNRVANDIDLVIEKAKGVDFNNPEQAATFYREFIKPTAGDWIDKVRFSSMLSSPNTVINNASSNLQGTGLLAPIEKTISGGIDAIVSGLTGSQRKYFAGEGVEYAKGYWSNMGKALQNFSDAMKGGSDAAEMYNVPLTKQGTGGRVAENTLSFFPRLAQATDELFKALTTGGLEKANAYRTTKGGVNQTADQIATEAKRRLFNQPFGSDQSYLLNALEFIPSKIMDATHSKNPFIKWTAKFAFPFIRIPTNVFKAGIEYSPLGVTTLPGANNKIEQASKALMGTTVALGAWQLANADRLTFGMPTSEKQRDSFTAAGMQPYSIKIGDKWISYTKFHPVVGFNMALASALKEQLDKKTISDDQMDTVIGVAGKWLTYFANQSYVKQMGDFMSLQSGNETAIGKAIGNYPSQLIPFRALMGWIARAFDPNERKIDPDGSKIDKSLQSIMMSIPGIRNTLMPRTDSMGEPVKQQNRFLNLVSPAKITNEVPGEKQIYENLKQKSIQTSKENAIKAELKKSDNQVSELGANRYAIVDKISGNVNTIDLNPIEKPTVTGNAESDKKLFSNYNSKITSQITGVNKLLEANYIDQNKAEQLIAELQSQRPNKTKVTSSKKVSTKKISTRKPKQIKLKSIKVPKVKQIKVKQIKVPEAKVIKLGKLKKPRTIKLKTIKYKK